MASLASSTVRYGVTTAYPSGIGFTAMDSSFLVGDSRGRELLDVLVLRVAAGAVEEERLGAYGLRLEAPRPQAVAGDVRGQAVCALDERRPQHLAQAVAGS